MRLRPTARGWALLAAGLALLQLGISLGAVDLVRFATLVLALVVASAVVLLATDRRHAGLDVTRTTTPNPVHAGEQAQVQVRISASTMGGRIALSGLKFAEQAATELSGGRALRARVSRAPKTVTVTYTVEPSRRGRWPLGPLVVTRHDPFGVVRTTTTLGLSAEIAVWPSVAPLPSPSDVLVGEPDRVALGARTPSTDDAQLRDYHEGDDLRRVHWASSARRGALMVRSDERAGMRPVSVLLDLPSRSSSLEWTISLAASMALAMLEGGHPVRLVGGGPAGASVPDSPEAGPFPLAFVHNRLGPAARAALLDRTIDLEGPRAAGEGEASLLAGAHLLDATDAAGEIVLAVVGPLGARARAALAHVADDAQAWALVRADGPTPAHEREAEHTISALRRAGWRACGVTPGEPIVDCWLRLLGSAR